jgi:hypothetical protein
MLAPDKVNIPPAIKQEPRIISSPPIMNPNAINSTKKSRRKKHKRSLMLQE